jgi:hypothetical protein
VDVSHEEPKFVDQMTKETYLIYQDTTTIVDSNIDEIVTYVLNSFDHAQQWDNKVDTNIESCNTFENMVKVVGSGVLDPPHHIMGGENQGTKIPSHIHPFPLHLDVVL